MLDNFLNLSMDEAVLLLFPAPADSEMTLAPPLPKNQTTEWFDASVGKSLSSGGAIDVLVKSWGVFCQ